jgi:hypothetical protein
MRFLVFPTIKIQNPQKSARHSKDFFKTGPLQGFTSKEPEPSLIR